jgi:alkylated DNA repair dioxygenase AlkB
MFKFTPVIDGETSLFYYQPNFLEKHEYTILKEWLDSKEFINGQCISGKQIPRQQLWYQKDLNYFCKKWRYEYDRWKAHPYEEVLTNIQKKIQDFAKNIHNICDDQLIQIPEINSCLLNKYRTGDDSIRPHRDTPDSFGIYPTIIGLSVGSSRPFSVKKIDYNPSNITSLKHDDNTELNMDITLEDNSIFIMAGASQKYFTHEIPKCSTQDTRYSLTFREYIDGYVH